MNKPIFGTKEWAASNANIQYGCQHDCLYCYAKAMSVRHKRIDIKDWSRPILCQDKISKKIGKRKGTIMFPTTHDLHPDQLPEILFFLESLLKPGNDVLIVSKPHYNVIMEICKKFLDYRDKILFRFTIGSPNPDALAFWEPGAPDFYERTSALHYAFYRGYKTSVSCEPMLDEDIDILIREVSGGTSDAIWLGKMNYAEQRMKINGVNTETKEAQYHIGRMKIWDEDRNIWDLYRRHERDPRIKWKESIKKIVGLDLATEKGLDI